MDATKRLSALVSGLSRRLFYDDDSITDELLKEKLFAGVEAEFDGANKRLCKMLASMAKGDMDSGEVERYLTAQGSKPGGVTDDEAAALIRFWKKERGNVHDELVKRSNWHDTLGSMSWRLDVLTKSRHVSELNAPAVIMEMKIDKSDKGGEVVRFEMGQAQIGDMLTQVEDIEAQIKSLTA